MRTWNDISLFQFQQIDRISSGTHDDLDKLLFITCALFGLTEHQLDTMKTTKAARLIRKAQRIFNKDFNPVACQKVGKYRIEYDAAKLTFGQYVEVSFFLQQPQIQAAHYVLASLSGSAEEHRQRADYFLTQPATKTIGSVKQFVEALNRFNGEYKSLFGVDEEVSGDVKGNVFNKRYGWIYSASAVAEYERIPLADAYKLPIRQALNDLVYLKAKARYEADQIKMKK